jgi:putative membrane protein
MSYWRRRDRTVLQADLKEGPEDPRVRFAAERTLLAWIRTGLALMGFGFVVARFGLFLLELQTIKEPGVHTHGVSVWTGIALIALGVAVNILAAVEHHRFLAELKDGKPYLAPRWSMGIMVAGVLAAMGIALAIYLMIVGR